MYEFFWRIMYFFLDNNVGNKYETLIPRNYYQTLFTRKNVLINRKLVVFLKIIFYIIIINLM